MAQPAQPQFPPPWGWPNGNYNGHWDSVNVNFWGTAGTTSSFTSSNNVQTLVIGNVAVPTQNKLLWFEFDYQLNPPGGISIQKFDDEQGNGNWVNNNFSQTTQQYLNSSMEAADLGSGWERAVFQYTISPQPAQEMIQFMVANTYIRNIYFSTQCVPEPSTFALLGLGTFLVGYAGRHRMAKA